MMPLPRKKIARRTEYRPVPRLAADASSFSESEKSEEEDGSEFESDPLRGVDGDGEARAHSQRSFVARLSRAIPLMIVFLAGALAVLLLFMLVNQPLSDSGVSLGHVVRTVNGSYAGLHLRDLNQHVFLGIPYATPPLGPLRFRRSEPFSRVLGRSPQRHRVRAYLSRIWGASPPFVPNIKPQSATNVS
jgi:hypothetical protein